MALIQYAAPWDRQPQEAVEPFPRTGLIGVFAPGVRDSQNLVTGLSDLADTGTVLRGVGSFGRVWIFNGSSTYLSCGISANRATPFTIISIVTPSNVTGHRQIAGFGTNGASSGSYGLRINSGTFGAFAYSSAGVFNESTGAAAVAGTTYVAGAVFASDTLRTVYVNGVAGAPNTTSSVITASDNFAIGVLKRSANTGYFAGNIGDTFVIEGALSDAEMAQMRTPADVYAWMFAHRSIWVPVSAGGGGTTISATPGNAAADGTTASVKRTIPATPGNASASGTTASVVRVIGAAPGNAVADGTTAAVTRSIAATPGNAVADGVTATVTNSGTTTISCTPGNAAADGALAAITRTIAAAPGNAVANGAIAALLRVIATTPGNAVADGVTAAVQASVTISCTPGNAVADGVAATVTAAVSQLDLILKILVNRQELNPATGTFTLYDDDATTVLYTTNAWADAAGTVPYSGGALRRIDALI